MTGATRRAITGRWPARRGRGFGAVVAATALAVLAACGSGEGVDVGDEDGDTGSDSGSDTGNGDGGNGDPDATLVAAISSQPDQFDPHQTTAYPSFQVLENVYDTLVVPNADGTFEPSLATEWNTSEDDLIWTFTLRDDVVFHDGSTFDAADVVYSFNRIIDEQLANAYRFESVESIESPDPTTVEITLSSPTPALLDNVGGFKGMAILPENAAEEYDLATEAVGTGPFTLGETSASGVTLERFEDYWSDPAGVAAVEIQYVTEATAALTALRSGEIHWTDNVPPQDITGLEEDEEVELGRTPSVDYWYLAVNQNRPPGDNRDFRRALAYGVDRESVAEAAWFDAATVNQTAIPEDSFWFHDYAPFEHDPDEARSLLQSAGVEEGHEMGLMVTDEYPETIQAAQVIQANLEEIGVSVQIDQQPFSTWLDRQGTGDFDAFLLGWLGNLDPFGFYHGQHHCDGANNFHGYCNPEVDQLLDDAAQETDPDARKDLYDQAAEIIVDDVSYLFLYNPDVVQAWSPDVQGYEVRADRAINFETVTIGG